ncbi:unnamed protein product [Symbiodinium microadriaticum]|nr:unnamed protein product [Symbiodinium microadriaticum]
MHKWQNLRGPNQWPMEQNCNPCKVTIAEYMDKMNTVGLIIMKSAGKILNQEVCDIDRYFSSPFSLLRLIRYPASGGAKIGVGEHTDYGFLTMIQQDPNVGGLEARTLSGEWVSVDPVPGTFAVNIGDAMAAWSGGKFKATPHRVLNTSNDKERLSIPFFFEPSLESVFDSECGGGLTWNESEPVRHYGEHLYRAYIRSYPFLENNA